MFKEKHKNPKRSVYDFLICYYSRDLFRIIAVLTRGQSHIWLRAV